MAYFNKTNLFAEEVGIPLFGKTIKFPDEHSHASLRNQLLLQTFGQKFNDVRKLTFEKLSDKNLKDKCLEFLEEQNLSACLKT